MSDGYFDARVVKYDKNGRFVKAVGKRGNANLEFNTPHSIATDFQGNVYVGDRGNARVQVLDNDLNWKANYTNVGNPWGVCVSGGPGPKNPGKQYLYSTNSWPDSQPAGPAEFTGEVYKMELDGTIVGKFGKAGKAPGEFATIHQMDCRDPNVILHRRDQRLAVAEDHPEAGRDDQPGRCAMIRAPPALRPWPRHCVAGGVLVGAQGPCRRSRSTPTPTCCARRIDVFVGEVGGVAANSKGVIFVYTRTGHPYATLGDNRTFYRGGAKLFQFDPAGKFVRELGQDVYGFNAAFGLRVDPQDNVWTIDVGANQVVKFDSRGPRRAGARPQA